MFDFEYQLKILPDKPGVYLMKNSLGEIIYVGKAKILKNRVRQYFMNSKNHTEKVKAMVKNIAEFEYIVTASEMEALILECNLIKKYSPKYNILLKDDKSYPFIKITTNEEFPRVFVTRNYARDGNKYFGPYANSTAVYETMNLVKKIFPIRTCKKNITENGEKTRPCLNYHIKKCNAPCEGHISRKEYLDIIKQVIDILNGTDTSIIHVLKKQMEEASDNLQFEKAAALRDKIMSIKYLAEKQRVFKTNDHDEDFINLYKDEQDVCIQVFFFRDGKITGREHFMLNNLADENNSKIISDFILRFYGGTAKISKNIVVPYILDKELVENFLQIKRETKVSIIIPQKGDKKKMLDMVYDNAKITLEQFRDKIKMEKEINKIALKELMQVLGTGQYPERIEAYDISNIQGVDSVGSMIVFENGKAKNSDYRRFKIKTVKGADDYSSMKEILTRRFKRGLDEIQKIKDTGFDKNINAKFSIFPDVIMMDGGKGQINIALEVLNDLGIDILVCGLVKDDKHQTRGIIYNNNEILIKRNSNLMQLIRRVQDEVHRFAITYHRTLRDKKTLHSVLDDIPYVGSKRKIALLSHFGGIASIKKASIDELLTVSTIDKKTAESIFAYFNNQKQNE